MKIGILTLPLNINYGGILQAYALQFVLKKKGCDVKFIDSNLFPSDVPRRFSKRRQIAVYTKRFLYRYLLRKDIVIRPDYEIVRRYKFISQNIQSFIDRYIQYVQLSQILKKDTVCVDTIIVGSDQVWRKSFTGKAIIDYFLHFLEKSSRIKRIAYAASFGSDTWEFTEDDTRKCTSLAKKFDLITVREDSGVEFCRKYLDVEATHVLDPTMLLDQSDYVDLIEQEDIKSTGDLFYYILDRSNAKKTIIDKVADEFRLSPFTTMPELETSIKSDIFVSYDERYCYPSIASWLRSFKDAKFVVTDSFHGCVFSIIFNKPFYVIGNKERGMARFDSLLKMFGLESRMIDLASLKDSSFSVDDAIDWERVNNIRKIYKKKSLDLLISALDIKKRE